MKARVIEQGRIISDKARTGIQELEENQGRESRLAIIQMLIPLALKAVEYQVQDEVIGLVGERYGHGSEHTRWGSNAGSIF
mgnify:CR=1 FL=1